MARPSPFQIGPEFRYEPEDPEARLHMLAGRQRMQTGMARQGIEQLAGPMSGWDLQREDEERRVPTVEMEEAGTAEKVLPAASAASGSVIGGVWGFLLGSLLPGIGNVIGAAVGSAAGGAAAGAGAQSVADDEALRRTQEWERKQYGRVFTAEKEGSAEADIISGVAKTAAAGIGAGTQAAMSPTTQTQPTVTPSPGGTTGTQGGLQEAVWNLPPDTSFSEQVQMAQTYAGQQGVEMADVDFAGQFGEGQYLYEASPTQAQAAAGTPGTVGWAPHIDMSNYYIPFGAPEVGGGASPMYMEKAPSWEETYIENPNLAFIIAARNRLRSLDAGEAPISPPVAAGGRSVDSEEWQQPGGSMSEMVEAARYGEAIPQRILPESYGRYEFPRTVTAAPPSQPEAGPPGETGILDIPHGMSMTEYIRLLRLQGLMPAR